MLRPLLLLPLSCLVLASCSRSDGPRTESDAPAQPQSPAEQAPATPAALPKPNPAKVLAQTVSGTYNPAERTAYSIKQANVTTIAQTPYIGAIAVDADTGRILFEDKADALGLPASMTKMMLLLLLQERIEAGTLTTNEIVAVSKNAADMGGSQVYLDPRESFPVEDLIYALIIQSANDAAVALAEHAAGSCEAMVALMNAKAAELGMVNTHFESVHGLPAAKGLPNDISTPRDMAILSLALCAHPAIFRYTGESFRIFRPNAKQPMEMRTHNPLLQQNMPGCDGLKTGYTKYAGYSISATVARGGHRVVVVMMGVPDKPTRNAKLRELLGAAEAAVNAQ